MAGKKKQGVEKDKDKIVKYLTLERSKRISPNYRRINVQS